MSAISLETLAEQIRRHVIEMTYLAQAPHVGSSLSICEILAVLYGSFSDASILISKGHAAAAVYAALALTGHFPIEMLKSYLQDGSLLQGHVSHHVPGVKLTTGSLGHALPVGCGLALADPSRHVFVLLSDGELNEGSNWEALLFAPKHLSNLSIIIDYNKIQSFGTVQEVLDLEPLIDKLVAFGWTVSEVDGHDPQAIFSSLQKFSAIIAHTIKGKGIKEIQNTLCSHYKPPNTSQYKEALCALGFH